MNIKFRQLKAFDMATRHGSFTQAAHAMAVTQPSFSALIKQLEHEVGITLFERTTRRCTLTEAGIWFHQEIGETLVHLEETYRQMSLAAAGLRGRLAIASLASLSVGVLPRALSEFRTRFPEVEIVLRERRNEDVFAGIVRREVELGLGSLLQADRRLTFVPMFSDRLMLVAPVGHPCAVQPTDWTTFQSYPYIMMRSGPAEHAIQAQKLRVAPAFEVEHVATAIALVRQGLGITLLPSSMIASLNVVDLSLTPMTGRMTRRTLGVGYRRNAALSRPATNFLGILRSLGSDKLIGLQPCGRSTLAA